MLLAKSIAQDLSCMLVARSSLNKLGVACTYQRGFPFSLFGTIPFPKTPGVHNNFNEIARRPQYVESLVQKPGYALLTQNCQIKKEVTRTEKSTLCRETRVEQFCEQARHSGPEPEDGT